MKEKIDTDLAKLVKEYEDKMESTCVIPFSMDNLGINDNDGNMLFSIACMRD